MAPPLPSVFVQGQGSVPADALNTFEQVLTNLAMLRTFTPVTGMGVFVQGFASQGDGGAGPFWWSPTSTATDDNANVIVPTGQITGAWLRLGYFESTTPYQYIVPVTGFSDTIPAGYGALIMNPASTLASGAVTIAAAQRDGWIVTIISTQNITSFSLSAAGATVEGAPTTLFANQYLSAQYVASQNTWFVTDASASTAPVLPGDTLYGNPTGASAPATSVPLGTGLAFSSGRLVTTTAMVGFPGFAISGLLSSSITGNSTTASLTVSTGSATDSTLTQVVLINSPLSWSVTNGNTANGFQGGTTLPNSTTVFLFVIWGTGVANASFASTSLTPTLPTNYLYYRRVGAFVTDSSGAPIAYAAQEGQGGSLIAKLNAPTLDVNGASIGTTRSLAPMNLPTGIAVEWNGTPIVTGPASPMYLMITGGNDPDVHSTGVTTAPGPDIFASTLGVPVSEFNRRPILTDTGGNIGYRGSTTGFLIYISTLGWIDYRRN